MIEELDKKQYILPDDYSEKSVLMLLDGINDFNKEHPESRIVIIATPDKKPLGFGEVKIIDGKETLQPMRQSALIKNLCSGCIYKYSDPYDNEVRTGIPTELLIRACEEFSYLFDVREIESQNNTYSTRIIYDCVGNVAMFFVVAFLGVYVVAHILYHTTPENKGEE